MRQDGQQLEFDFCVEPREERPEIQPKSVPPTVASDDLEAHGRRIAGYLSIYLPKPVDVVMTNNRRTMISCAERSGRLVVRLHKLFRHADSLMLGHLVSYLRRRRSPKSSKAIDDFIYRYKNEITAAEKRAVKTVTEGAHYDLAEVLAGVNEDYFGGRVNVCITWGRRPAYRRRRGGLRSRALATYCYDDQTIRVSPVLDSQKVPRYMIDWVIYHELLHHMLPIERKDGRNRYHGPGFKRLEKAFRHYAEAQVWEEQNKDWLTR